MVGVAIHERLMRRVVATETCWLWQGYINADGYGIIRGPNTGPPLLVHRVSYGEFVGSIPPSQQVCHRCDVRSCVRPEHLFLGSALDNQRDKATKGRSAKGGGHGNAKLSDERVLSIRARHAAGMSQAALAAEERCSRHAINQIVRRQTWIHI